MYRRLTLACRLLLYSRGDAEQGHNQSELGGRGGGPLGKNLVATAESRAARQHQNRHRVPHEQGREEGEGGPHVQDRAPVGVQDDCRAQNVGQVRRLAQRQAGPEHVHHHSGRGDTDAVLDRQRRRQGGREPAGQAEEREHEHQVPELRRGALVVFVSPQRHRFGDRRQEIGPGKGGRTREEHQHQQVCYLVLIRLSYLATSPV